MTFLKILRIYAIDWNTTNICHDNNIPTYICHGLKYDKYMSQKQIDRQILATDWKYDKYMPQKKWKNAWREENTHLYLVGRVVRGQKRFTRLYAGRRGANLNIWTSKPLSGGRSGVTRACSRRIRSIFWNLSKKNRHKLKIKSKKGQKWKSKIFYLSYYICNKINGEKQMQHWNNKTSAKCRKTSNGKHGIGFVDVSRSNDLQNGVDGG